MQLDDVADAPNGEEQQDVDHTPQDDGGEDYTPTPEDLDAAQPEYEMADFEWEGSKYQVPSPLQDLLGMGVDYRKKTMDHADQVRAHEKAVQEWQEQQKLQTQYFDDISEAKRLTAELAEYQKVDWDAWEQQDPDKAGMADRRRNRLERELNAVRTRIQNKISEDQRKEKEQREAHMAKFREQLPLKIKDWNEDKQKKLAQFVQQTYGYKPEDFDSIDDIRAMQIIHDAYVGRTLRQQKPQEEQVQPKPVSKVGGGKSNVVNITGKETPEEYRRKRVAQQKKTFKG